MTQIIKPGHKTTEFYVLGITALGVAADVIPHSDQKWAGVLAVVYALSRSLVKFGAALGFKGGDALAPLLGNTVQGSPAGAMLSSAAPSDSPVAPAATE